MSLTPYNCMPIYARRQLSSVRESTQCDGALRYSFYTGIEVFQQERRPVGLCPAGTRPIDPPSYSAGEEPLMTKAYKIDKEPVVAQLNSIMESELAGVVRYTHYSLMVFGYGRIPIVSWFQGQANESLLHAQQAGEMVTHLGGHPSLSIGALLETHHHDIGDMLRETIEAEFATLNLYYELLKTVEGKSVPLEEYARRLISEEEMHIDEIDKMLRRPGQIEVSEEAEKMAT